ncbi:MAG: M28 family peptidase [Ignavibacteria bacterium]|nr:M28 family peptidase [Ignavibacteria bacterium]
MPVSKERLYADVEKLTSVNPPRNHANLSSLNTVADYIFDEFKKLNCKVEFQNYTANGYEYKNVQTSFGPETKERIIVGAHYDVCGNQPGADDNASAVAGMLEIARLISELKPELKYRVDFAAYTLEEPPYFRTKYMGSAVHAKSLKKAGSKVKIMICLEMIGYFSEEEHSQKYPIFFMKWFYPDTANYILLIAKVGQSKIVNEVKKIMKEGSDIDVQSANVPRFIPGIDFSDHLNYWNENYEAIMVTDTAFYRNPNYHSASDTIDTLDFDKIAEVVKGIYWVVVNL